MDAEKVYDLALEFAEEFDADFAQCLKRDPDFTKAILAIGRGGKKPRKDLATWQDVKPYMGFFYDEYFVSEGFGEKYEASVIRGALEAFLETYDPSEDANTWFEKVKAVTAKIGFAADMKEYKQSPDAFPGSVADVSTFIRIAVTGKTNSPDLYTVMQILGDKAVERIRTAIAGL